MPATTPTSLHRPLVLGGEAQTWSPGPAAPAPPAAPGVSWASQQQALPTAAVKSGSGCVSQFRPRTTPPRDGPAAHAPPLPGARGTASSTWLGAGAETPDFPGNPVPLTRFSLRKATRDAERSREMTRGPVQAPRDRRGPPERRDRRLKQERRRGARPTRLCRAGGGWKAVCVQDGRPAPVSPPHSQRPLGVELHLPRDLPSLWVPWTSSGAAHCKMGESQPSPGATSRGQCSCTLIGRKEMAEKWLDSRGDRKRSQMVPQRPHGVQEAPGCEAAAKPTAADGDLGTRSLCPTRPRSRQKRGVSGRRATPASSC